MVETLEAAEAQVLQLQVQHQTSLQALEKNKKSADSAIKQLDETLQSEREKYAALQKRHALATRRQVSTPCGYPPDVWRLHKQLHQGQVRCCGFAN